jgi:hypothetical protein
LIYLLGFTFLCLPLGTSAAAQASNASAGGTDSAIQRAAAPDSWERIEQLAPNSLLKISAKRNGGKCVLQSVSADGLVCLHGRSIRTVQRSEIESIRFARRGRSALTGLGIGAAAGAGLGAAVGPAINSTDSGSLLHVAGGKSALVGTALGVIIGGATGGFIGYRNDLFPGPVIYKR